MKKQFYSLLNASVLLLMLIVSASAAYAQGRAVSGTVTSSDDGTGLPGVTIQIKGTTKGAISDADGKFTINVANDDAVLVLNYVGYTMQEVVVGTQSQVNVTLQVDLTTLDEIVVTGYSGTDPKNILGSVVSIKSKDMVQTTPVSTFDAIQGRLSGVQISSNGGPGAGYDIQIRGTSTFGSGTSPLFVVDGQQLENIDNLDPSQIESLVVLKDGASAAIYGSKAANGVVIITTKSGKSGENKIDVSFATSFGKLRTKIPVANTKQRIFYENARNGNVGLDPAIGDSLSYFYQNSFDLQEMLTQVGVRNQVNVSFSGGGTKSRYYWDSGYLDEKGIIQNSGYKRMNSTFKLDNDIGNKIRAGFRMNISYEEQKGLNEGTVFQQIVERIPYFPVLEPNGDYTPEIAGRQNPLAEANATTMLDRNFRTQIQNYIEWQILPSLTLRSTLGVNGRFEKRNDFEPTIVQTVGRAPRGRERQDLSFDILQENILTWKKTFGEHHLQVLGGTTVQRYNLESSDLFAEFNNDYVQTFNNASDVYFQRITSKRRHSLTGLFSDVTYDYKGKYLAGVTVRRDGSSRFGENTKYGVFPAFKVGWRVSGEPFMQGLSNVISDLKLTATMGTTGNERIGDYESQALLRPGFIYQGSNGIAPYQLGNADLSWESTTETNLGANMAFLDGRFTADIAFWKKETKDLLYDVNIPAETGFTSARQNVGSVENKGVDIAVGGSVLKKGNFEWFTNFNIGFVKNKVIELKDGQSLIDDPNNRTAYILEEGQPIGNMYGFKNLGVFQYNESNAFTDEGIQLTPVFAPEGTFESYTLNGQAYTGTVNKLKVGSTVLVGGDIIWQDLNGDFNINASDDRQVIGNGLPKFFGGFYNEFKYKEWALSLLFDYNFGNDIFRQYDQARNDLNSSNETPGPERIEGAWRLPGDITEYARLNRVNQNALQNSQYVSSGDYIRLRNIKLSYRLASTITNRVKFLGGATVYMSVNNLFTLTNYPGYNPDLGRRGNSLRPGEDQLRYPNKSDLIFGLNLTLN